MARHFVVVVVVFILHLSNVDVCFLILVLGLGQGRTHDLAAGIVFILEIIAEITEIIEE